MLSKVCIAAGVIDARQQQSMAQINTLPKAEVCGNRASPRTWMLFPAVIYTYKYSILTSFMGGERLTSPAVVYLCCLLMGSVLQVHTCLKPPLPDETRHFYYLLPFFLYLSRNLAFTFAQWEEKLLPATLMGLS